MSRTPRPAPDADLNLLPALDALLEEGSVTGAARRLGLSPSAMSRTLARLRAATGDPLLVRAGRGLVPTPRADALRERVRQLAEDAAAVLRPVGTGLDLAVLERTFVVGANEGFADAFAGPLVVAVTGAAPGVRLCFAPKPDRDVRPLRDGLVDLEIGVLGDTGPEVRVQTVFREAFVGAARAGHPLLASGDVTPEHYAACGHVVKVVGGRRADGPVDDALAMLGLTRRVVAEVPSFPAALAVVRASDLVAVVTSSPLAAVRGAARAPGAEDTGDVVQAFAPPVRTEAITVSQMWHPRVDADPAHRWLRTVVRATCRAVARPSA